MRSLRFDFVDIRIYTHYYTHVKHHSLPNTCPFLCFATPNLFAFFSTASIRLSMFCLTRQFLLRRLLPLLFLFSSRPFELFSFFRAETLFLPSRDRRPEFTKTSSYLSSERQVHHEREQDVPPVQLKDPHDAQRVKSFSRRALAIFLDGNTSSARCSSPWWWWSPSVVSTTLAWSPASSSKPICDRIRTRENNDFKKKSCIFPNQKGSPSLFFFL